MYDYKWKSLEHLENTGLILNGNKKPLYIVASILCGLFFPFAIKNYYLGYHWLALILAIVAIATCIDIFAVYKNRKLPIQQNIIVSLLVLSLFLTVYYLGSYAVVWAFPVVISLLFILPLKTAYVFNGIILFTTGGLASLNMPFEVAIRTLPSLFLTIVISSILLKHIEELQARLENESMRDPLTGAYNRRQLSMNLETCIAQKKRNNLDSVILMIDIDHFKRINDQFGHDSGDRVIKHLATMLIEQTREIDLLFRVGGEEFILLMQGMNVSEALIIAKKLRTNIKEEKIIKNCSVTVSIGVSSTVNTVSEDLWVKHADEALYKAKNSGRDQVQLYNPSITKLTTT